jgi:hypothetical protein
MTARMAWDLDTQQVEIIGRPRILSRDAETWRTARPPGGGRLSKSARRRLRRGHMTIPPESPRGPRRPVSLATG